MTGTRMARIGALVAGLLSFTVPAVASAPEPGFIDTPLVAGLEQPTAIAFLPDGTFLVTEKGGALKHVAGATTTTLITIPVCTVWETGLLGIALDPDFGTNGWVYLYRTKPLNGCGPHENQVVRVTLAPDGTIDPASLVELLGGINSFLAHNGGVVRVGPDGKLYVGVGDSGTSARAQDPGLLEGKVLRLERDGSVPPDNPFVRQPGVRGEVFALGLRNPFRFDFDPLSGRLWAGDVGLSTMEEIDIIVAGGNYAWPRCEGTEPPGCHQPGDVPPIFAYGRTEPTSLGTAIIGGTFAGDALAPFTGHYVFTDIGAGVIYRGRPTIGRDALVGLPVRIVGDAGLVVDFVRTADGAIAYVVLDRGEVRRLSTTGRDDVPVGGTRLVLRAGTKPEGRRLSVSSRDPGLLVGTDDDPTLAGGEVYLRGPGFEAVYRLPKERWSRRANGAEIYTDRGLEDGPIRKVVSRAGRLKIDGRGAGLEPLPGAADPRPIEIVLGVGMRRHCLRFGGDGHLVPGRQLVATDAPAPGVCPP